MVGQVSHSFSATQAEALSNSAGVATTWVGPNEWNSLHSINATLTGSTAGASTVSGTNIILGASQNLTVSGTSNSIYFVGPQISSWMPWPQTGADAQVSIGNLANGSIYGGFFVLPVELALSHIDIRIDPKFTGPLFATSSTTHTSSASGGTTMLMGIWSRQQGASSSVLTLVASTSMSMRYSLSQSGTSSSNSNSLSITFMSGVPYTSTSGSYSGSSTSSAAAGWTASGAGAPATSLFTTTSQGYPFPIAATLEPGEYFVGLYDSTAGTGIAAGASFGISNIQMISYNNTDNFDGGWFGFGGGASATGLYNPRLMMSTSTSTGLPASWVISNLSVQATGAPWCQLMGWGTTSNWV